MEFNFKDGDTIELRDGSLLIFKHNTNVEIKTNAPQMRWPRRG